MLIQEPVQVAIWTNLNFYAFEDAIFLAERLLAEVETDESLYLLATCYYRSGRTNEAYWLLHSKGASTHKSKFLLAKCAFELKHYSEAENILCNNKTPKSQKDLDALAKEYGIELSGYVMQLLSKIYRQTERSMLANDCCRASLKSNPFLWHSFSDLCNRGERPNVKEIFQIRSDELLVQLENQLLNNIPNAAERTSGAANENNISISGLQQSCINIPNNNIMTTAHHFNNVNTTTTTADDTPLIENQTVGVQFFEVETPYHKQFKYLNLNLSPVTPSFGVLPLSSPIVGDSLKQTTLFITPSPPLQQNQQSQLIDTDKNISNKKIRGNLNSLVNRKEITTTTPLQQTQQSKPPVVLNQSSNIASPNRTPQEQRNQNVRRSSRIFSNYSVKENNKSPKFSKFVQPRSPPRKTSKRVSKSSKSTLNELNEKNTILNEKEKIETVTSAQAKAVGCEQSMLQMKRQSADGLMILLQSLGEAYMHLQHYELEEALEILETRVPLHHFNSSWVQSLIALIHHERREYEQAVKIFGKIHEREPYRLQYLEIYSTDLWHLQKETLLSILAQDLMQHSKNSAVTWCVAGNCFSVLKEHDTAIKFFNRAIQLDPEFSYSYTLLGHELVVTEELEKALGCYRKAILKDSRHYNAWYGIGTIYSKQERFQLAEIHFRQALKINRKNSVILVHIGVMQFYLNKREQAIQTMLDAIKLDPNNPLCKFHHASMNFNIGKLHEALEELEELKQIVPKESVVFYLIGKIHKQLGNIDLALMHFSWATDLDPKGANNQIKDKFDSVIRSHQQTEPSDGDVRSREEFDDDDDVSLDEEDIDATTSNDNNNSSGGLEESEMSMNQDH